MSVNIRGKEYITVNERLQEFNEKYPNGSIQTVMSFEGEKIVRCAATIIPDVSNLSRSFTGNSEERRDDGNINRTSATENCETSAIGRALGMMGIGINDSVASADEVVNALSKQGLVDEPFRDADGPSELKFKHSCPKCNVGHNGPYPTCINCYKAKSKT